MVPQFDSLTIQNYGLFPGAKKDHQFHIDFSEELTVIAGINGLGKTTLLTLLLRMISGPFDITTSGSPERYEAILPSEPKRLKPTVIDFFSQRVADARDSVAELSLKFGKESFVIKRNLATLSLLEFSSPRSDQQNIEDDTSEASYQTAITECFNLSSFVDVLLMLHNLIFFNERKAGALWDSNAQRHVLGAIVLDKTLSREFSDITRRVQTADSQYRNTRAQLGKFQRQLNDYAAKEESSPRVRAELEAIITAIDGAAEKLTDLENQYSSSSEAHRFRRLELEKAKLENESASGLVERAKYTSLLHSFPKMHDAARLLLARILSEDDCLVCGAEAKEKREELEQLLLNGHCPACGSDPSKQTEHVEHNEFEHAKMANAKKKAEVAAKELQKAERTFQEIDTQNNLLLHKVIEARSELNQLSASQERLNGLLPEDSKRAQGLRQMVDGFTKELASERITLDQASFEYEKLLGRVTAEIVESAEKLSKKFGGHIEKLLAEKAQLVSRTSKARIGQESSSAFDFPFFIAEMSAANRPGLTARQSKDDVSESQRELIDLAFRLALIEVASSDGRATFVMETPEASLDGLAMKRVGQTLREFASGADRRLIISNNLTNAGMVTAIFGGPTSNARDRIQRFKSVVNLLEEATPNQALIDNRAEYEDLLDLAITGNT